MTAYDQRGEPFARDEDEDEHVDDDLVDERSLKDLEPEVESGPLTTLERELIEFSKLHWAYPGARSSAILERFGFSETIYMSKLNRLIDRPEAEAWDAQSVHRLQRLRAKRRRQRSAQARNLTV